MLVTMLHTIVTHHVVLGYGTNGVIAYVQKSKEYGHTGAQSRHNQPPVRTTSLREPAPVVHHLHVSFDVDVGHEKYAVLETELSN